MDLKDILELIHFEILLEGFGLLAGTSLLWYLFFQNGLHTLLLLFTETLC